MPKRVVASDSQSLSMTTGASGTARSSRATENRRNTSARNRVEDERWRVEKQTLRRAAAELAHRRAQLKVAAMSDLATVGEENSLEVITKSLEDPSASVRNAAVRALYRVNPGFAASFFNQALREGPLDRRRRIGAALAGSGLVAEAIQHLKTDGSQNLYGTLSLLFLVAKAGEVQLLMGLLESHPGLELRLALIELLGSTGDPLIVPALRRLSLRTSLPEEVRSAVKEAIHQISSQTGEVDSRQ
jgi:HEAT repeat protein